MTSTPGSGGRPAGTACVAPARLTGATSPALVATAGGPEPTVLVALDSATASSRAAVGVLTTRLPADQVVVLAPEGIETGIAAHRNWTATSPGALVGELPEVRSVVSLGHHLPAGRLGHEVARRSGARHFVVQHGLLTPLAPPLPVDTTLLAWSEEDAAFWRATRSDGDFEVVGSQLLWDAAAAGAVDAGEQAPLTFLGQLHGVEVGRAQMARVAVQFCTAHHAVYRPHPAEVDRLSRLQHRWWRRRGMTIDDSGRPLASLDGGVVGVFSTGVLEAAARGLRAWVHHPDPPAWVGELWERYELSPFGGSPTAKPDLPACEPAARIEQLVSPADVSTP